MRVNLMTAVMTAALFTAPALAQTTAPATPPSSPAPAATAPASPAPVAAPAGVVTQQEMGQYLASKMPGVDVRNSSNEKIGDIADLVMDKDGKISAVIISVGGFLGMGKHDVAIPLAEVKFMHEDVTTRTSTTTTTAPMAPAAPGAAPRTEPTTTGTVATTSTAPAPRAYPNHVVVNMTAEQLKAAPAFKYAN